MEQEMSDHKPVFAVMRYEANKFDARVRDHGVVREIIESKNLKEQQQPRTQLSTGPSTSLNTAAPSVVPRTRVARKILARHGKLQKVMD